MSFARMPQYLSPSAIALWEENPSDYYLRYLAANKPPGTLQTQPMAIGSAFDAYVKSYLYDSLFGKRDSKYDFQALFEAQVEEQNRDWALGRGKYAFEQYKQSGCLTDLMLLLNKSASEPRFEFDIKGVVQGSREPTSLTLDEVTLLGKPDCHFVTTGEQNVILDWKINGFCSKYPKSPAPYYLRLRGAGKTNYGQHKKCRPMMVGDIEVNCGCYLEDVDKGWAQQLAIYGWLLGMPIGSGFVTIIHQGVCSPNSYGLPSMRFAEHINRISDTFQYQVFDKAVRLWRIVHDEPSWFFRDMTREESTGRCELLERVYAFGNEEVDIWT